MLNPAYIARAYVQLPATDQEFVNMRYVLACIFGTIKTLIDEHRNPKV